MPFVASGQNLITNGNFESGYNTGWNHLAGDGGSATYSDETVSPQEGAHALKVVITALGANGWSIQSLGPTVNLTIGENYTLTYWGKAAVAGTNFRIVVQNTVYTADTKSLGTTWTQYTWAFTAQETSPSIRLQYPATGTVWLDDIQLVADTPPPPGPVQITLSPETKHQTMIGFGGALTWYSAWMYYGTKANEINQIMFDDLGLDILRLKNWYYPTNYPTQTVMQPEASFDSAKKFYDAAKAINPDIQVFLSSWSPPANLKSNGERPNGGTLTKDGNGNYHYAEFAQYWVDCLDNLGWTPDYLSFQNEPGWVASWESCIFEPTETATNAGYSEAADAIWNAIKDRPNAPRMIGSEAENMPAFFNLNTPVLGKSYFDVHAYHTYDIQNASAIDSSTTKNRLNRIRDDFGDRQNWMTEYSNDGFDWIQAARVVHNTVAEANASAYVYWKLAWTDTSPGYMIGLTNTDWNSYQLGPHFYSIKHYAKHVDKGYQRIEIGGSNANVKVSGYLSVDRSSITLVAINQNASTEQIELNHSLSISGITGYQSVTGNYYQSMTGLDAAQPIDLPSQSLTTLVLTLSSPINATPVSDDAAVVTSANSAVAVTLNAADGDDDQLTYTILSGPTNGSLSGSDANRTYIPNTDFVGNDTITFKVNDGFVDSNVATISITVNPPANPILDVNLPAGISLYGYTGANPIDAEAAFQTLITNSQFSLLRWVNPADGQIKELYYTTFPSAGWINEIGDLMLGQGYVVKTKVSCTLSIAGAKDTTSVSMDLPSGYSIIGYNKETPMNAQTAFQDLITAGRLDLVRWVDPSNGQIKELYYTTYPSPAWINEINELTEGQGYIIKLNAPHASFQLP